MAGDPSNKTLYPNGADIYSKGSGYITQPTITTAPSYGIGYSDPTLPSPFLFNYSNVEYSFVREGYEFVEWNTAADGSGTSAAPGDYARGNWYAIWQPLATGSGGGSLTVSYDGNQIWQGTSGNLTLPTDGKMMDGDITLALTGGGGGGGNPVAEPNDVEFIDYDGTIRYSYTAAEFANLTALPDNPTHEGLTAQGWNWTLADAKTYVNLTGNIIIGQMYITDDNTTRIYIDLEEGRLSPILGICPNGTATINWGDGSATTTLSGTSTSTLKTANHTYPAAGKYKITISMSANGILGIGLGGASTSWGSKLISLNRNTSGSGYYYNSSSSTSSSYVNDVYISCMKHIELGSNVTLGEYALSHACGLESIIISKGITSTSNGCFYPANTLKCVVFPNTVTSLGQYTFYGCNSLQKLSIPKSVTSIGTDAIRQCNSLQRYLPPDSATLSLHTSGTETNFQSCRSIRYIHLPHTMTSLSGFTNGILISGMACLSSVTIPSNVTTINGGINGVGLGYIKFEPTTPPTAPSSTGFNMLPLDCKIYVPSASLSAYKTATNYPPSGRFTYIGY